jgi:predicted nucleotide-binding protein
MLNAKAETNKRICIEMPGQNEKLLWEDKNMNAFDEQVFRLIDLMIAHRDEQKGQTGDIGFRNKWLQEKSGCSAEELNDLVDYMADKDFIEGYRTRGSKELPFLFKTISLRPDGRRWYHEQKSKMNMPKEPATPHENKPSDPAKVFIVHGRNGKARAALFDFLRSIGLKPIEWSQAVRATGKGAPYVGEILDAAFSEAQAVVVLMSPDDFAYLRNELRKDKEPIYETQPTPQARPNVLFEAGMALGRHPDRTILVELGDLRPFSDVVGRHTIRFDNSTQTRQDLADRLETAGCPVDLSGRDWHTAGDFEAALEGL